MKEHNLKWSTHFRVRLRLGFFNFVDGRKLSTITDYGCFKFCNPEKHILGQAKLRGLSNIEVLTCDVNVLELDQARFDRVVSVEMFEHVRNYQRLLKNSAMVKAGRITLVSYFLSSLLHYPFEVKSDYDWMSKYFFTGGLMPSTSTFCIFKSI